MKKTIFSTFKKNSISNIQKNNVKGGNILPVCVDDGLVSCA